MPRMEIFEHKFSVATDDVFLFAGVSVFNRVFVALVACFGLFVANGTIFEGCDNNDKEIEEVEQVRSLVVSITAYLAVLGGSIILYLALGYFSTRGTPCDEDKRSAVPKIIPVLGMVYLAEMIILLRLGALAAVWPSADDLGGCAEDLVPKTTVLVASIIIILLDLIRSGIAIKFFLSRFSPTGDGVHMEEGDISSQEWEKCLRYSFGSVFRIMTCNLYGYVETVGDESSDAFRSAAQVFTLWFKNTGLTFTDLGAALTLYHLEQKRVADLDAKVRPSKYVENRKARTENHNLLPGSVEALDASTQPGLLEAGLPTKETTLAYLSELNYYIPFIMGIYGWRMAFPYEPMVTITQLVSAKSPRPTGRRNGDNVLKCSQRTLLVSTGLQPKDVIYAHFSSVAPDDSKTIHIPHAVIVDHKKKAVVVAIRGTLSLQDFLTDLMIEPEELNVAGECWGFQGSGHYAHDGFLMVAMKIRVMLEKNRVLHRLFGVERETSTRAQQLVQEMKGLEQTNVPDKDLPDCSSGYHLVVVGHSAGAGIASLLTLFLRDLFPAVRCLAYSGPGFVMSYELAEMSKQWCVNTWVGDDIVPHINWTMLKRLRRSAFDMLRRSKASKARILWNAYKGKDASGLLYEESEVPDTPGRKWAAMKLLELKEKVPRTSKRIENIPMYPPGKLLHMAKVETLLPASRFKKSKPGQTDVFQPFWVPDRSLLNDPFISRRSLFDHLPHQLKGIFPAAAERVTLDL